MNLTDILILRAHIARLGERDFFQWWDSEAGTVTGGYVLTRLLPRTARWASIELAVSAARVRHSAYLPQIPTLHLFDLGVQFERELADRFYQLKTEGGDQTPFGPDLPVEARTSVMAALQALGVDAEAGDAAERAVCLGDASLIMLAEPESIVLSLARAYGRSTPGRLVVPYFRLVNA